MSRKTILAWAFCCLGLVVAAARGEVIRVPADYPTIQEAIDAAQNGDEVVVSDGIWTGGQNRNLRLRGKAITVRSENGPANCIIDCKGRGTGFYFKREGTHESIVDGFTITRGSGLGSGVYCYKASPTIRNCIITDGSGSGIYCSRSSPMIAGCTITGNTVDSQSLRDRGGGIACWSQGNPVITDCTINKNRAYGGGGGIACEQSSPTISNCVIRDNICSRAGDGGGIYCTRYSNPTITRCEITENEAYTGGGIFSDRDSYSIITDSRISNNVAFDEYSGAGGVECWGSNATFTGCTINQNLGACAVRVGVDYLKFSHCTIAENTGIGIWCATWGPNVAVISHCTIARNRGGILCDGSGSLLLTNCTITENQSYPHFGGGGVYYRDGNVLTIANCIISGNSTPRWGGGIYSSPLSTGATLVIINSILSGNSAGISGGGLHNARAALTVANCLITHNTATENGGGIFVTESIPEIADCTIVANKAGNVGGGVCSTYGSDTLLANSILWDNKAQAGPQIAVRFYREPASVTVSYDDVQGGRKDVLVEPGSTLNWGKGNITDDPRFVDPEGGDYRLAAGSPCIDAADNFAVPRGVTIDLDGMMRFYDDPDTPDTGKGKPPIVDMGGYEFSSLPPCTGGEKLRARCFEKQGANRLKGVVRHGQPGAILTFRLDGDRDSDIYATVKDAGRAKATFEGLAAGRHTIEVIECGLRRKAKCL